MTDWTKRLTLHASQVGTPGLHTLALDGEMFGPLMPEDKARRTRSFFLRCLPELARILAEKPVVGPRLPALVVAPTDSGPEPAPDAYGASQAAAIIEQVKGGAE